VSSPAAEAELEMQRALDALDADDLALAAVCISAAAHALAQAEKDGEDLGELPRRFSELALWSWLPRAAEHAPTVERDAERRAYYHTLVGVTLAGISFMPPEKQHAELAHVGRLIEGFELMMDAPLA
jgi:hypothetical protein